MPEPLRIAYTLEQCWHSVPGGSAAATLEVGRRLMSRTDVMMVGVAGRHRHPPPAAFAPPMPVRSLPLARPWLYETWNRFGWPAVERATGPVDVCHSTVAIPAPSAAPSVVTIHDVAFVHTPERFTGHGVKVMRAGLERCRAASLILCPSEATIADLRQIGFDPGRLRLVPWGVEPLPVEPGAFERVRRVYSLPERFVLFVGTVEPRKNLARLAEALAGLDERMTLVVAGADGWGSDAARGREAATARFLGFVPAADLAAIYRAASVFAYPSLQEGFGMPIVEAMAYGVPVVTSRGSATEEVADGAAVLVDPNDTASITSGMNEALADRDRLVAAGLERAGRLSWDAAAEATVAAYREAAA